MKVLYLGPVKTELIDYILMFKDSVIQMDNIVPVDYFINEDFDFVISYGYRYIIPEKVVNHYDGKMINLHISYLPWNRGADPNFWSFLENSKKGVTIHYIAAGLDTGDVIAQKEITFSGKETLASSYAQLTYEIEKLFKEQWPKIREGKNFRKKQEGEGSFHLLKDKERYLYILKDGWDTPVSKIQNLSERVESVERNKN